ncbi:MAG: cupredoxin domain-containing protein [Armatimonadota bacterium]|nr:cupredoxin domain-containing protein [Armatimonadota bacterium]MDR7452363.1 cupredoxin domain-containing protein [Armatimonadota bacterium]MDR7466923.1 cupredoxin domain-containing protein [Armatimonadota bacterium]MDR7493535.1 cupredoxin domain-containing protein [Armatimonadota bacterium]MDR7498800.1 cupredoxin domain-containing protein [Armatimonadota bacterium]
MAHRFWLAVLVLAVLTLSACGPGGGGGPSGGGAPPTGGGGAGGAVSVTEHEWAIEMPKEVPSGTVTFTVKNDGAVEHNFVIQETGQRLDGIMPGQTKTFQVTLRPGTYTIVCDIPGHSEAGMKTTVTAK